MLNGSDPLFPDDFIHLGGDEVDLSCWNKNKDILAYMKKNNLTAATLLSQWIQDVRSRTYGSVDKKNIIYWEDAFNYTSSSVDNTTIFAVWRDKRTLHSIAKAGSQSTLSAGWYIHAQSKFTHSTITTNHRPPDSSHASCTYDIGYGIGCDIPRKIVRHLA